MASFITTPNVLKLRTSCTGYLSKVSMHQNSIVVKPPNILIYGTKDSTNNEIKMIQDVLLSDRYAVYNINSKSLKEHPWMDNTKLLIIPNLSVTCKNVDTTADQKFILSYLANGGKILNFSNEYMEFIKLNETELDSIVKSIQINKDFKFKELKEQQIKEIKVADKFYHKRSEGEVVHCSIPLTVETKPMLGKEILRYLLNELGITETRSDVNIQLPQITPYFLFSKSAENKSQFINMMQSLNKPKFQLICAGNVPEENSHHIENESVIVIYSDDSLYFYKEKKKQQNLFHKFDWDIFYTNLDTKEFGNSALYADVVTSTMNVFDGVVTPDPGNVTVICRQQTGGMGRGGNVWLSPIGCAMFTSCFSISFSSAIGQNVSVTQHVMALAFVHAIRSIDGLQNLDLRIKWPNDIYIGSEIKIGGILSKSAIFRDKIFLNIGIGVNLSNDHPTKCINWLIKQQCPKMKPLACEQVIALTLTQLEKIIEDFQSNGPESFMKLYYKYWIHSNTEVTVQVPTNSIGKDFREESGTIVGIDAAGFLKVKLKSQPDQVVSLQPDGNSFDITKNLIVMKRSR